MKSSQVLEEFLAEVVMTSHYLAEPVRKSSEELHDAEMKCLKIVDTFQPLSLHVIADYMHCGKARATQLVHSLESKGFVERASAQDHRVALISTTRKGKASVASLRSKYRDLARKIKQTLGDNDTQKLCEVLERITPLTQFHEVSLTAKGGNK